MAAITSFPSRPNSQHSVECRLPEELYVLINLTSGRHGEKRQSAAITRADETMMKIHRVPLVLTRVAKVDGLNSSLPVSHNCILHQIISAGLSHCLGYLYNSIYNNIYNSYIIYIILYFLLSLRSFI